MNLQRFVPLFQEDSLDYPMTCQMMRTLAGGEADLTMTHPSGAQGVFRLGYNRLYRSNVADSTGWCDAATGPEGTDLTWRSYQPMVPTRYDVLALKSKTLTGPGLPAPQLWQFHHQDNFQSKVPEGYPINGTRTATTTKPDGNTVVEVFGTDALVNEAQLLSNEVREGAALLSRRDNSYVQTSEMASMPFPDWMGEPLAYEFTRGRSDYNRPLKQSVLQQQGVSFSSTVNTFDVLVRPLLTTTSSTLPGNPSRSEATGYHDNLAKWVLSQVAQVKCVAPTAPLPAGCGLSGTVMSQTTYDPTFAVPLTTTSFGKLQKTSTYDTASTVTTGQRGTLKTIKDGNNNVITVSNWKRGIPQTIKYPATPETPSGATQSATVNDLGWITSVIDESGNKRCYGYDAMGRLSKLFYPSETVVGACDDPATQSQITWNPTTLLFEKVASAEYGIAAGHWRQTISTGNARKISYFDALWQPLVVREYDTTNVAGTQRFSRFSYDYEGRPTFASYPGITEALTTGVWTERDALGRVKSVAQDSESGPLVTLTNYLGGFQTKTTNPRLQQITTSYKAYDAPTLDWPVAISHPEGAVTSISRDVFGKPTALTRGNASGTLLTTRSYAYDAHQQLCLSLEPETGATLMGYDGAGNLAWSATGLSPSLQCSNSADAAVLARKATRTYDARNRVASLSFPDGLGNTGYVYKPDGKLHSLSADNGGGTIVTSTYGYKRRGQPATERLQWTGVDLNVSYGYDSNGSLAAVGAPGLTVDYAPNALGQATQAGSYATGVQYYPNGAIKQFTYGNGIIHSMAQNARQLPTRVVDSGGVLDNEYAYDANGNVQSILDWRDSNQNRAMTYDGLDRLLTATSPAFAAGGGGQMHQFTYDVLDNLQSWTRTGAKDYAQYLYVNNQLTSIRNSSNATIAGLSYDEQGNLRNKNGQTYIFDYGNRLRTATGKGTFAYDGHGRRVLDRTTADKHSLYSQSGQLLYENDLRQARMTQHVYLGGSLVARVVNSTAPAVPLLTVPAYNTTGSYTVSWSASSNATGYQLEEAVSGGAWTAVYSGTGLSAAISGKLASNYGYRVRACLNAGCSAWSGTSSVSVQFPPATAPVASAPTTAAGGNYTVSWTSIAGSVEYKLQVSINAGAWTAAYTGAALSQPYSNQPAAAYAYRVQACNPAGCGPYSATVNVQSVHAPGASPALTAPSVGAQGNFTVSWTAVSTATSYSLDRSISGAGWTSVYTGAGSSQAYAAQPAGSYAFRVKACNAAGCGPVSAVGTVQSLYAPGSAPSLTVPATGINGAFTVSWSAVGGATAYVLDRSDNGAAWASIYNGAATSQAYSGHAAGTFAYRVTACNAAGCGPTSGSGTAQVIYTPTTAPTPSVPASNGTGNYTVSWSAVGGATSYQLQESTNGSGWNGLYNGAATSLGIGGRAPATYGYRAVACNAAGCGPNSGTANTVVSYIPAVPTGLTGWKARDEQAQPPVTNWRVDWNASTGSTYYEVQMKVGTGATNPLYSGANTFVTGTGIGTRQFWVRACNGTGCSAWSSPVTL